MSTTIDIGGPLLLRVLDEDGVSVLLERSLRKGETLFLDTEPDPPAQRVVTMVMGDKVALKEG